MPTKQNIRNLGNEVRIGLAVAYDSIPKVGKDKHSRASLYFAILLYILTIVMIIFGYMGWAIIPLVIANLSLLGYFMQREHDRVYKTAK